MKKWLIFIICLVVLIISSSMTYEQQNILPELKDLLANKPFEKQLSVLKIPYWDTVVSVEERGYFPFVEFLIRKLTHFIGFGCIALGLYFAWGRRRFAATIAITGTAFIAMLDEFRQSFTPGRTMSSQDVLVDTAGAIIFVGVVVVFRKLLKNKRQKALV
ncbi:VanZ family protein [Lysinibacillus fusiformis]|uniref:VanZ family protein n=1 Tax=Lysinibacillus fusiformis TaxID=28031 RepID=UPI00087ED522|nr:VanZ family protein [Lysinibacillus fusiformis]SCX37956.1 VanZ like family protein [Lysinibacillus fusiformis]SDB04519.1 VanZ like family protein [Lysinibacillus fusiformis]SFH73231.1 VanZ like family protein [Lysinibacillus fusiformis]SFS71297.1 VanZ like family protein [Lysinibacillus fusiformis]